MKKFELFPTPVIEFDLSDHPNLNYIIKIIDRNTPVSHSLIEKGVSSIASNNNILFSPDLIELKNDFQKCVDYYSQEVKIQNTYIYESWFNVMENQGKVKPHNHGGSVISGAFYPFLQEDTCNLYFKSPLYTSLNFQPLYRTTDHFQDDVKMNIKPNHLYLFPGWLTHYTEKNKGDKRIVLSFNTKFY